MAYGRRVLPRIMVSNAFGFLLNWLKLYGFMPMRHPLSSCGRASIAARLWVLAWKARSLGAVVHARTNLPPQNFGSVTTVELCTKMVCLPWGHVVKGCAYLHRQSRPKHSVVTSRRHSACTLLHAQNNHAGNSNANLATSQLCATVHAVGLMQHTF